MWGRLFCDAHEAMRSLWRTGRSAVFLSWTSLTVAMVAAILTYAVVEAVLIRPLPYRDPQSLVGISGGRASTGQLGLVSPKVYFDWAQGAEAFEAIEAARLTPALTIEIHGHVQTLQVVRVTPGLFDLLGVRAAEGRLFDPEHSRSGGLGAVVLSHELWHRQFGADPAVVGRRLTFGTEVREVLGVLERGVTYPVRPGRSPDIFVPYVPAVRDRENSVATSMFVVGRMRPGVTIDGARADLERFGPAVVLPLHEVAMGSAGAWLTLAMIAVSFLLLVAGANASSLLLARALGRSREFAIRQMVGVSRSSLQRTLLVEGAALALASLAVAMAVAVWIVNPLVQLLPPGLSQVSSIAINHQVVLFAVGIYLMSAALSAGAPLWMVRRLDLAQVVQGSGGGHIVGRWSNRALIVLQIVNVAFVAALLVGTALVVTTLVIVSTIDLGMDPSRVVRISFERPLIQVPANERQSAASALRANILAQVRAVPGVTEAAIAFNEMAPFVGGGVRYTLGISHLGEMSLEDALWTNMVTPTYFQVMGMSLSRGRLLADSDHSGAPAVMLINETAARRFFPGRDPIGEVVSFRGPTTIVGVLEDALFDGPEGAARPEMYTPLEQEPFVAIGRSSPAIGTVFVRVASDPRQLSTDIRQAVKRGLEGIEPGPPRYSDEDYSRLLERRRFNAGVMLAFAGVAVAIGITGIYGLTSFMVRQEFSAIAVRMTLGASPAHVLRRVLFRTLVYVGVGTAIGLVVATMFSGTLAAFVFGVRPTEPWVYLSVALVLAAVGIVATLGPAREASRLAPMQVLRKKGL